MSFIVDFHKITDPVNCANKTVDSSTLIKSVSGVLIEEEDICNPSFLINYQDSLLECNYCYIAKYKRYYFCRPVTENGGNIRINCAVDALRTFWDEYSEQDMTLVRSTEFGRPTYVQDSLLPIDDSRISKSVSIEFNSIHQATDERRTAVYYVVNTV